MESEEPVTVATGASSINSQGVESPFDRLEDSCTSEPKVSQEWAWDEAVAVGDARRLGVVCR